MARALVGTAARTQPLVGAQGGVGPNATLLRCGFQPGASPVEAFLHAAILTQDAIQLLEEIVLKHRADTSWRCVANSRPRAALGHMVGPFQSHTGWAVLCVRDTLSR